MARRSLSDVHTAVAVRLLAMMGLYSLCRGAFYLANRNIFVDMSQAQVVRAFVGGLVFDASAVAYTSLLFIALALLPLRRRVSHGYQRATGLVFFVPNAVGVGLNLFDIGFYRTTLRRSTSLLFPELAHEHNLLMLFLRTVVTHWPLAASFALVVWGLWWWRKPAVASDHTGRLHGRAFYITATAIWLGAIFVATIACRGGWYTRHHRPITLSNAGAYVDKPNHMAMVLNTPFCVIRTVRQPPLTKTRHFKDEAGLAKVFDPTHHRAPGRARNPTNVVIIILESFGAEHVGGLNHHLDNGAYQGFTPFLDSLMGKSLNFTNAFANGGKTIDALPSITASIPFLIEPFILSRYSSNRINSIASLLRARGYTTAFFHGAPNGSMGFDAFVHMAGYEKYYGMSEYANDNDYDGTWGIWDEEFFQFFAKTLDESRRPFFATLLTLSSHHPYRIPERYQGKLRRGAARVEEAIHYSDHALARLFATLEKMPWYHDTVFVLTADHNSEPVRPEYVNMVGRFRVPLLFFTPNGALRGRDERPAQHIDIMPTVLGYVGQQSDYVAFGHDLLATSEPRFVITYTDGVSQLIDDEYALQRDRRYVRGMHRYREDRLLEHNLSDSMPEKRDELVRLIDAVVEQFSLRMIDDRMTTASSSYRQ